MQYGHCTLPLISDKRDLLLIIAIMAQSMITNGRELSRLSRKVAITTVTRLYHRKFKVLDGYVDLKTPKMLSQRKLNESVEAELQGKIEKARDGGGTRAIERHTKLNKKMLVRDRLAKLLDEDYPFLELSQLAGHYLDYGDVPGAGSVMGIGSISGQLCVITANDATVKGGTIYPIGVKKQLRAQEIALENNIPCVYIVDSGGGFLPLQSELFLPGGRSFYNEAVMSSLGIPQVTTFLNAKNCVTTWYKVYLNVWC